MTDTGAIEAIVDEIIASNAPQVAQFKSGNEKILGFFVGQAMKATQGKANPKLLNEMLRTKLK
jgi:aspartyl-tRNA(Asn)/glutamyl-tRNA(Gln) amidotransferase subunit B